MLLLFPYNHGLRVAEGLVLSYDCEYLHSGTRPCQTPAEVSSVTSFVRGAPNSTQIGWSSRRAKTSELPASGARKSPNWPGSA